jgi:hypothetical protein
LYAIVEIVQHVFAKKIHLREKFFRAARYFTRVAKRLRATKTIFVRSRNASID